MAPAALNKHVINWRERDLNTSEQQRHIYMNETTEEVRYKTKPPNKQPLFTLTYTFTAIDFPLIVV